MLQHPGVTPCTVGQDGMVGSASHLGPVRCRHGDDRSLPLRERRRRHSTPPLTGPHSVTHHDVSDGHIAPGREDGHLGGHAPCAVVLGATETLGFIGGEQLDLGSVGELELAE